MPLQRVLVQLLSAAVQRSPAVANMTLSSSYALIQIGHRKPLQSLPLNV
jgi:hypothetical protein